MDLTLIIKLVSLFILIWFGFVNGVKVSRGHSVTGTNVAVMSAAAVAFIWSMGWLS